MSRLKIKEEALDNTCSIAGRFGSHGDGLKEVMHTHQFAA